jgi:mono/diheme cytochrome c family protein
MRSLVAMGAVALIVGLVVRPQPASALPAYSRLYQAKYGYRPSCGACHTSGGGSAVTEYGRDFLRAGANANAYTKIETKDSDGDGATNAAEISGKSNPGDAKSVIGSVGDWLEGTDAVPVPTAELKKLFPAADSFSAVEGTLSAAQVASAEARSGSKLSAEDRLPTFYFAIRDGKKTGVAQYVSAPTVAGPVSLAVVMDASGVVTAVFVLKNPADDGIEDAAWLAQFRGKRLADAATLSRSVSAAPGAEEASRSVAGAVARAIAIISAVFSR